MEFTLFSKLHIQFRNPMSLIECYCFQTNFYRYYDLLSSRKLEDVGKIGARIDRTVLEECESIISQTEDLRIFRLKDGLDGFLGLDDKTITDCVNDLCQQVISRLLKVRGIGLSKATKLLHTVHPEIIPMIDNLYQSAYCRENVRSLTEDQSNEILADYYKNLKIGDNLANLSMLSGQLRSRHLIGLTKVRVFDILWWSYLKSKDMANILNEKNPDFRWSVVFES